MKIKMTTQIKVEPYKKCSGIYCDDCEHACNCNMKRDSDNAHTIRKENE